MPHIIMYSTERCGYCVRAEMFLRRKGLDVEKRLIDRNEQFLAELLSKTGTRTVPQIFIDEHHVGGFDDLMAMDSTGELDRLLLPNARS